MAGIKSYIEESYQELVHKVTWPSWKELQESAVLVFIASLIIAGVVFLMDYVFGVNPGEDVLWKGLIGFLYEYVL
ncbi:MAG: preprotein translocase subunit SecE [Flavobacteriales bacterium]|jgi:preprotein translocase subunit SecE